MSYGSHDYEVPSLLIGGTWRPATSRRFRDVVNPATGQILGTLGLASQGDLAEALLSTEQGFSVWRAIPAAERAARMELGVAALRAEAESIAVLLTLEQGKPLAEARAEVNAAADFVKWYAEEGRRAYGRLIPGRMPDSTMAVHKLPVGPIAAFSPWNFPLVLSARKIGGALAAGCSIILKAAEETPASVAAMVRCFAQHLPPGTLQLLYGEPSEVAGTLIAAKCIRKISFTGSANIGKALARAAANDLKRVTLELGGHAPVIVWSDADLDRAIPQLIAQKFRNAGQACLAPTRFLVHRDRYVEFLDRFGGAAAALQVGDGILPETQMGPLANVRRQAAMRPLVDDAVHCGARILSGGAVKRDGFFWGPTVLADVPPHANIMTEEPFGPLAPVTPVESLAQALDIANATPYGLAGYLYTDSARVIRDVTERLEVGALAINSIAVTAPEAPFGGVKDSGYGCESGIEGLDEYLDTKFVHYSARVML